MNRITRRHKLLREKRNGCFHPSQYYLEGDLHARALRKIRVSVRRMQPLTIVGTAWDSRTGLLLEVASSLATQDQPVWMHIAECMELRGWDRIEVERWLVARFAESLGMQSVSRSLAQLQGARLSDILSECIRLAKGKDRCGLILHGVHELPEEVRQEWMHWMENYYCSTAPQNRAIVCLLTGPKDVVVGSWDEVQLPHWAAIECSDDEYIGPARLQLVGS